MFDVQPPTGAPVLRSAAAREAGGPGAGLRVVLKPERAQDPGRAFTMDAMRAFLTEKGVARQYWPEWLEPPRTASSKIRKFELHDRGARRALATMCIGVGQGIAVLFEAA